MSAGAENTARLGLASLTDPIARITDCEFGRHTEVAERCAMIETPLGDYSHFMPDSRTWAARIGKFADIASHHPVWRASPHPFSYRANDDWPDAGPDEAFFKSRQENNVVIGPDVRIGSGAAIMPGVTVGNGALVTRDVDPYAIVGGGPARALKPRFESGIGERMDALARWDWRHERPRVAPPDFRSPSAEAFLEKHGA